MESYLSKVKQSLNLMLNDVPDHRDDTIIAKFLDLLKSDILSNERTVIFDVVRSFLVDNVLEGDNAVDELDSKELEVTKFYLDLISVTVQREVNSPYLASILNFVHSYFEKYSTDLTAVNPSVLVSLIELVIRLQSITTDNTLNERIIKPHLLAPTNLDTFLSPESCKSIYIRDIYKKLYLNYVLEGQFVALVSPNLNNLDVVNDLFKHYLFNGNHDDRLLNELGRLMEKFNEISEQFLLDCDRYLSTDMQIEAFTYMSAFGVVLSQNVLENFTKMINKLCNHFAARITTINYKKASNLLFKFLVYARSFLDEFEKSTLKANDLNLDLLRSVIHQLFTLPLHLKFSNATGNDAENVENYLLVLDQLPIGVKNFLLRQFAYNMKLYMRKFPDCVDLADALGSTQIIYLLKSAHIEPGCKMLIIDCMREFFELNRLNMNARRVDYMRELFDYLVDSFRMNDLELKNEINSSVYGFISVCLEVNLPFDEQILIKTINFNLNHCADLNQQVTVEINDTKNLTLVELNGFESKSSSLYESEHFLKNFTDLLEFLVRLLLGRSGGGLLFVRKLLTHPECQLVKFCYGFLVAAVENHAEVKEVIYRFLATLNETLDIGAELLVDEQMETFVEKATLAETEAFVRREQVKFLTFNYVRKFQLTMNRNDVNTNQLLKHLNFISDLLLNDLDWEVQLICMKYFQSNIDLIDKLAEFATSLTGNNTHECAYSPIEIVFCVSDFANSVIRCYTSDYYDKHVVCQSAKLLFNLKSSRLMTLLERLNDKNSSTRPNGQLSEFLQSIQATQLEEKIKHTQTTSDIYSTRPESILDDIISSYQFDIDDDKAIDCY